MPQHGYPHAPLLGLWRRCWNDLRDIKDRGCRIPLKKTIDDKNPVASCDVDVGTLALYRVSLPDATDAQLEQSLKNLSLDKQERLGARTK